MTDAVKKVSSIEKEAEKSTAKTVICANKEKYVKTRSASGKPTMSCGDDVAIAFGGLTLSQKYALASKILGIDRKELTAKYEHLNDGMIGMTLANRVRGVVNKDLNAEEPTGLLEKMNELAGASAKSNIADADAKSKADAKPVEKKEKAA